MSATCPLQRCGGCQLVAYCSRECQKDDWSRHKFACKEFPLSGGKNVLCTTGPWREHIDALRERAVQIPNAMPIFLNPRVCSTCREARQDRLSDCLCGTVSYCSKRCSKADKQHIDHHATLSQIGQMPAFVDTPPELPNMRDITVSKSFKIASCWGDIIPEKFLDAYRNLVCLGKGLTASLEDTLMSERISYSMSLLFALQSLP